MTRINPNEYRFCTIILVVTIWLTGCSVTNKSFTTDIRVVEDEGYTKIFSPKKKFSLVMYGDYDIADKMSGKELKINAKIAKQLSLNINVHRSFLLKGTTFVDPFYKNMIFIDDVFNRDTTFQQKGILQDRKGNPVYYYLQEDSGKRFLFLSHIVQGTEEENNFAEYNLEPENESMLNTLLFNTSYIP